MPGPAIRFNEGDASTTRIAVLCAAALVNPLDWFPNGIRENFGTRGEATSVPTKVPSCCNCGAIEPEKNVGISLGRGGAEPCDGPLETGTQFAGTSFSSIRFGFFGSSAITSPQSIDRRWSCYTIRSRLRSFQNQS